MNCELCHKHEATKSSIVGEFYYKHLCGWCYTKLTKFNLPSGGSAEYDRGRDAEEHEAHMIQPYSGGKISKEFIHLYPETAQKMWTAAEIDQANRS